MAVQERLQEEVQIPSIPYLPIKRIFRFISGCGADSVRLMRVSRFIFQKIRFS